MEQLSQNMRTGQISVDEVPTPALLPGHVLVQTAFSVISAGTERTRIETGKKSLLGKALARPDQVRQVLRSISTSGLDATYQKVKTRLESRSPIGYSASGIVIAAGPGVIDFQPGDRVACAGATAAHAEIISVPVNLCVKLPPAVALDDAAFTTLGAIALQGIRLAAPQLGECVVVMGLGLLGLLAVQMLKASGCSVAGYDPNAARCELALKLGADAAAAGESDLQAALSRLSDNHGADAVIITAGSRSSRPVELAGEISREKGRVIVVGAVGLTLPRAPYYDKELDFRISRSYGPGRYDASYEEKGIDYPYGYVRWTERRNMQAFVALLASGRVDVQTLITHRFRLAEAAAAYELISGKTGQPSLGVLFTYPLADQSLAAVQSQPAAAGRRVQLRPPQPLNQGQLGIGVIGAGNFAQSMLLPHLKKNPRVVLQSVTTTTPLHTRDAGERFGFSYAASGHAEILQDERVQAVVIATRHDSHAALVIDALQAGKPVHVEKPLVVRPDDLNAVESAYNSAPSPFVMVGFNRRFAPLVREALRFLGGPGEPFALSYRINAGYLPPNHWTQDPEQGGGRIVGEVCHFVDLASFICRSPVQTVYAQALPNQGKYCTDNVAVVLGMANGSVANILYVANGDRGLPKEYLEIYHQGKVAVLDDFKTLSLVSGGRKRVTRSTSQDKGHAAEMGALVTAVLEGHPEPVPFTEAAAATRATFAILESLSQGSPVQMGTLTTG